MSDGITGVELLSFASAILNDKKLVTLSKLLVVWGRIRFAQEHPSTPFFHSKVLELEIELLMTCREFRFRGVLTPNSIIWIGTHSLNWFLPVCLSESRKTQYIKFFLTSIDILACALNPAFLRGISSINCRRQPVRAFSD
jgi:hypothetical protein